MRLLRPLLVLATLLIAIAAHAADDRIVVLTAHPAAHAIASSLAAGSSVEVKAVQPAKLPATRLASFLGGRGAEALRKAVETADAVVTFRSFWPDDPLYPHARRADIRIVEIDAGRPLDGALPGIALLTPPEDRETYEALGLSPMPASGEGSAPWLSPTALGRMADVVAADLELLAPAAKKQIASNLAEMKRRLIAAKAKADSGLAEAPSTTVLALSGRYGYLANDLGLELVASVTAAPSEWTPERAEKLSALIKRQSIAAVILDGDPSADLAAAIERAGARLVTMAQVEGETVDVVGVVEANLTRIAEALRGGR